jgi:hypothetical protein
MSTWGNNEPAARRPRTPAEKYVDEVGRFLSTIRVTRVVLLVLIAVGTVLGAIIASELFLVPLVYGAVSALGVYVVVGWLEHSLRLLCGVYVNGHPNASHD